MIDRLGGKYVYIPSTKTTFAKFCAQWYEITAVSGVRLEWVFLGVGGVTNANSKM